MEEKTKLKVLFYFTISYLIFFAIMSVIKENYEFLFYSSIIAVLISIVVLYHKQMRLTYYVLFGLAMLGVLHISGGNITIFGTRLYDFFLIPGLLRYDQLVHAFGTFVLIFVIYGLLFPYLDNRAKQNPLLISLLLVLAAMGVGALNEILELGSVIFLGAAKEVGGYLNNALDLLFDFIGAILASFFVIKNYRKKK